MDGRDFWKAIIDRKVEIVTREDDIHEAMVADCQRGVQAGGKWLYFDEPDPDPEWAQPFERLDLTEIFPG